MTSGRGFGGTVTVVQRQNDLADAQRSSHMCCLGVGCFFINGRITSCVKVRLALKILGSSVEIIASTSSRQNSPIITGGSISRIADAIIS